MILREFAAGAAHCFFPVSCPLCGEPPSTAREALRGVCDHCASALRPESGARCSSCGRTLVSETGLCMECREKEAPPHDAARALFHYSGDAGRLLRAYKFGRHRNAAAFISDLFAAAVLELEKESGLALTVVPVPPRPGKIKKTGWDQMEAIARALEIAHGRRASRCLRRTDGAVQKRLGREARMENARSLFSCIGQPPSAAALIDDVTTTGSTLAGCARALKSAGCPYIAVIALCYD